MRCTVIGCCGGCCRVNEACSAYLLSCQGEHLLLDCGSGAASMLQNALPLQELHHVLLSHYHYDHCSDAGALSYGRLIQMQTGAAQQPLHFYGLPVEPYFERLAILLHLSQNSTSGGVPCGKSKMWAVHSGVYGRWRLYAPTGRVCRGCRSSDRRVQPVCRGGWSPCWPHDQYGRGPTGA